MLGLNGVHYRGVPLYTQSIQKYTHNTRPTYSDKLVCGMILLELTMNQCLHSHVCTVVGKLHNACDPNIIPKPWNQVRTASQISSWDGTWTMTTSCRDAK